MSTAVQNGHADHHQPNADGGHHITPSPPQSEAEREAEKDKKLKQLLVKQRTHLLVRNLARRLGRSNDAVIRRAIYLLDKETGGQQVKTDDDWADEVAS